MSSSKQEFRRLETGLGVQNANFPIDPDGRVYHVGVKHGEVANRIVTVGDPHRAEMLAGFFDKPADGEDAFSLRTNRGFTTHTGIYRGVPMTIVATGMGTAMMDFMVREVAAVTDGQLVFVRLGTCGSMSADLPVGHLCVTTSSVLCHRNEDAWDVDSDVAPYHFSRLAVLADSGLVESLREQLMQGMGEDEASKVASGGNCTADTFYASQGRLSDAFDDRNETLITALKVQHPHTLTLEMETFQLLHLAACARDQRIRAAATCIILANRVDNAFLDAEEKHRLEAIAGRAIMDTLAAMELDEEMATGVWEHSKK